MISSGYTEDAFKVTIGLLFSLLLIWFGDEIGEYTGFIPRPPFYISNTTPGIFIKFFGWILLLLISVISVGELFYK